MTKPDISFFVIGAARSGTTSIYKTLSTHPEIYDCPVKEPRFFSENWKKGWDWYADQYASAPGGLKLGDYSPNYSNASGHNSIPDRIAEAYPEARIIYMVRNPIDCAISNWRMTAEGAKKTIPFGEAFQRVWTPTVLHRSLFFKQISEYRRCFKDSQILVIPLEAMRTNPSKWLETVQIHLGVAPAITGFPKANASSRKPNRPAVPVTSMEERKAFIEAVTDDARSLLTYIGLPETFWNLSVKAPNWRAGA